MHIDEIKAFAMKTGLVQRFGGRNARVYVALPCPTDRKTMLYIRQGGGFTPQIGEAHIYRFDEDGVADQCVEVLEQVGVEPQVTEYERNLPDELD
jgi:hypothetical protein